jgi:hypothetical protein
VNDIRHFQDLVHQGDVAVREVHRRTGSGGEVVVSPDGRRNYQVINNLTIDFGNHLIGHEVGESALSIDIMDRLQVLGGLQTPGGLQLAGDSRNRVAVDGQRHLWLEGVGFQIVLIINPSDSSRREDARRERNLHHPSGVVEGGRTGRIDIHRKVAGKVGAIAHEDDVGVPVGVETDAKARYSVVAVRAGGRVRIIDFNSNRTGQHGSVSQGGGNDGVTGNGSVLAPHLLRRVVRVKSPTILAGKRLGGVLPHDLGTGNRLALGEGVTVADVENEAGRLAHRLDTDEVIGDELGVALADEREGETGEVGDIGGSGLIFEDERSFSGFQQLNWFSRMAAIRPNF